jgi:hypothetical protein
VGSFVVMMLLGFERRPSGDEQAFLGDLNAKVQPWGIADLQVVLDLDAPDMAAAVGRAQELVVDRLGADLLMARVALPGFDVRPGSWWSRRLRRRRARAVKDADDARLSPGVLPTDEPRDERRST